MSYVTALRAAYEQQLATMGSLSNPSAAAAASLLGYNPYMMAAASPFGGLGAFAGLGGINPSDYQTAAAAAAMSSGFPSLAGRQHCF